MTIQPDGVLLKQDGDRHDGRIDVLIVQFDARRNQIEGPADTHETIELKMLGETYRKFMAEGLGMRKTVAPSPRAETLKIVVRDAGSGMIGSITVPLREL